MALDPDIRGRILATGDEHRFQEAFYAGHPGHHADDVALVSAMQRSLLEAIAGHGEHEDVRAIASRLSGADIGMSEELAELARTSRETFAAEASAGGDEEELRDAMRPLASALIEETLARVADVLRSVSPVTPPRRHGAGGLALRDDPYGPLSSEHALFQIRQALARPEAWERPAEGPGWPTAKLTGEEVRGEVQLVPLGMDAASWQSPDEKASFERMAWRWRDELSPLDMDVLALTSMLWVTRSSLDANREVAIGIDEYLAARRLKANPGGSGRRGGYTSEQRADIIRCIAHIEAVQITAEVMVPVGTGKKRRHERQRLTTRLFDFGDHIGQRMLDDRTDVRAVLVRPRGMYAAHLILHRFAHYDTRIFGYSVKRAAEKMLYDIHAQNWRVNASKSDPSPARRVSDLLVQTGIGFDKKRPGRSVERLERAHDQLEEDSFLTWQYEGWNPEQQGEPGWPARYLESARIRTDRPAAVEAHYTDAIPLRETPARRKPASAADIATRLRETRRRLGYNQARAAEEVGISQQSLSRAERGGKLTADTRRKLERWVTSHAAASDA